VKPRIKVRLKRIPKKRKQGIELVLSARFKTIDQLTGDISYQQLKILLCERILSSNWDFDMSRPIAVFSEKDRFKLHNFIEKHILKLKQAYSLVEENPLFEIITPKDVRQQYLKLTGQDRSVQVQARITHFIDAYISKSRIEKQSTKSQYQLLAQRFRQFELDSKQACYWQNYDFSVHESFIHWLQTEFALSQNTLWNYEKLIFKFRSLARTQGLLLDINPWRKVSRYRQTNKMYLTWEMLRKIMKYSPPNSSLKNTKNVFLILVFTGIRISDLHSFMFNYHDDHPFGWSRFRLAKHPSPEVVIPVLEPVRKIMENERPYDISTSQFHSKLKLLMTLVFDIDTAKQISAHTARRTFITLLLPHVQEGVLRKITGHAITGTSKVFWGYDRLSLKDNAVVFMRQVKSIPIHESCSIRLSRFSEEIRLN